MSVDLTPGLSYIQQGGAYWYFNTSPISLLLIVTVSVESAVMNSYLYLNRFDGMVQDNFITGGQVSTSYPFTSLRSTGGGSVTRVVLPPGCALRSEFTQGTTKALDSLPWEVFIVISTQKQPVPSPSAVVMPPLTPKTLTMTGQQDITRTSDYQFGPIVSDRSFAAGLVTVITGSNNANSYPIGSALGINTPPIVFKNNNTFLVKLFFICKTYDSVQYMSTWTAGGSGYTTWDINTMLNFYGGGCIFWQGYLQPGGWVRTYGSVNSNAAFSTTSFLNVYCSVVPGWAQIS